MEKRPRLERDYTGLLTGKSCYHFCKFVSDEYELKGEHELALDWLAEANLYKMEVDLGIRSVSSNPMINLELNKNKDAWDAVTEDWSQVFKRWEQNQQESKRQKLENQMRREKEAAEAKQAEIEEAA
jgi:hypothetical protein